MYDPDQPKKNAKSLLSVPPPGKPLTYSLSDIVPDNETFRWQIGSSELVRNAHGIGKEKGRLVVIDKAKLDKVEPWKKDVIREYWKEINK